MTAPPVVLVLGPTASGKSALAVEIARRTGGEIVSADAFAVYRGLDIGTAKPSSEIRAEIPHHLIDVADPVEPFSAGRWAAEAQGAIRGIEHRGRLPIIVGGSHFYVRALLSGLPGGAVESAALRRYLAEGWSESGRAFRKRMLDVLDPAYAARVPAGDTGRLSRALEIVLSTGRRVTERAPAVPGLVGRRLLRLALLFPKEDLYTRISRRVREMWTSGWPREVESLLAQGVPPDAPAFRAIGYAELVRRGAGELTDDEALARIVSRTRALAKRQRTWLASEPELETLDFDAAVRRAAAFAEGAP
ncbi:MAG TPA: tRNA (adenosine(37)-N6)-dimethylallyltransferase MiaA [Thermoanaerobaculia bacterium]|nr:tRNA (adenosine(37)-N6)-dimethylallyltransferase MiaA [Thermoanaerobaculia bacterium]